MLSAKCRDPLRWRRDDRDGPLMDPIIKQRLVGSLVLVALGIVFWPLIFVDNPGRESISVAPMPERPFVDTSPLAAPESLQSEVEPLLPGEPSGEGFDQTAADEATRIDEAPNTSDLAPAADLDPMTTRSLPPEDESLIDEQGLPVFWVLQVAAMGTQSSAETLVADLMARGYKAFINPMQRADDTLYRVQIGPNAERAKLTSVKNEIDRVLGVDSQILRYVQSNG